MHNQHNYSHQTERYLTLWIYLLPIIGVIPAIWTLYLSQKGRETRETDSEKRHLTKLSDKDNYDRQKVSRLSITLILIWLSSYCLLSLGAANTSGIIAFRLLYINAISTTGYFLTCTFLMLNLHKRNLFSADK